MGRDTTHRVVPCQANLSHRCRTEDALAAVEQAVLARLPGGVESAEPEGVMLQQENQTLVQNFEWVCQARSRAMTSLPLPHKSAISA